MQSKNKSQPLVSVIIPIRELSYFLLFENLPAHADQVMKNFEVIVLPNEHSTYDLTLLKKYSWLRIVATGPVTRPAEKRNIGVKEAKGTYIAFIDDDAFPDRMWLQNAVTLLKTRRMRAVCGPGMIPDNSSTWEQAFDLLLRSRIGSGTYTYRFAKQSSRLVLDFPSMNFLMRREDFLTLGGFKNDYWPGEDSKLCNEITTLLKGKIRYDPSVVVYHHRRPSLDTFLRQHGQYGFHRGAFFAHGDQNSQELTYVIPTLFTLYLMILFPIIMATTLVQLHLLTFAFALPLFLYGLLSILFFIQSFISSRSVFVAFKAMIALVGMHLVYGVQFIRGFQKGRKKTHSIYE